MEQCFIKRGIFGQWIVVNAADERMAWSGSQWVPHVNGLPAGLVQVSNFASQQEAAAYAKQFGFTIINPLVN